MNVGLGIGVLADRSAGRRATRDLAAFVEHARRVGVLGACPWARSPARALGAWLKMGLVGTEPARDRVLLVGDAAGLVNPLQGEGIAQAMDSGRAAAEAILGGVDRSAGDYRAHLARAHGDYLSTAASVHRSLLRRPQLVAPFTRGLTAPAVSRSLAGAWSITWNDLLDGAPRSRATAAATVVAGLGRASSPLGAPTDAGSASTSGRARARSPRPLLLRHDPLELDERIRTRGAGHLHHRLGDRPGEPERRLVPRADGGPSS